MKRTQALVPHLPFLRRYARALTGSQRSGDAYVRATLEAVLGGQLDLEASSMVRVDLYRLFHAIWTSSAGAEPRSQDLIDQSASPDERLQALPPLSRVALLLTAVERFSINEVGEILGLDDSEVEAQLDEAQKQIEASLATKVLIVEDEMVIALDLKGLVEQLGHEVVGIAATHAEAVKLARKHEPGLILADVQLADGSSGIDAVQEILPSANVPVIFITAFPERLLTGERAEPAYLIAKPFLPETVVATISQALFFHNEPAETV